MTRFVCGALHVVCKNILFFFSLLVSRCKRSRKQVHVSLFWKDILVLYTVVVFRLIRYLLHRHLGIRLSRYGIYQRNLAFVR